MLTLTPPRDSTDIPKIENPGKYTASSWLTCRKLSRPMFHHFFSVCQCHKPLFAILAMLYWSWMICKRLFEKFVTMTQSSWTHGSNQCGTRTLSRPVPQAQQSQNACLLINRLHDKVVVLHFGKRNGAGGLEESRRIVWVHVYSES